MKKEIILLSVCATVTVACAVFYAHAPILCMMGFVAAYIAIGFRTVRTAVRTILQGQMLDEHFLMTVATIGAFCIGEYAEAVAVMLFYRIGELFEKAAVRKSRRSIAELMQIRPDFATVLRGEDAVTVPVEEVRVCDILLVRTGEKVPTDGVVVDGESSLDTAALTGESLPRPVRVGDEILGGCINREGTLRVRVTKRFAQSTVARILELVESAAAKKSKTETFITRFAHYYTPIVTASALLLAVIPPLFLGNWTDWISRALSFLVVSCPCALVISVPLAFFGGIGGAARHGILLKGGNHLEALAQAKVLVCDKTGTLTTGQFSVVDCVCAQGVNREELLSLAASAEIDSSHPLAQAIVRAASENLPRPRAVKEFAGQGVVAEVDGAQIAVGNLRLMQSQSVQGLPTVQEAASACVWVAKNGIYCGRILLADNLKSDAQEAIATLRADGVGRFAVLTGDAKHNTHTLQEALRPEQIYADLLPSDKVDCLETILSAGGGVIYVGDGINDAPVLARADIGVAMGALGSDAAMEAADVVLMNDRLCDLCTARRIAKKTCRIARQNTVFAIGVKVAVLLLCAFGVTGMWAAVFADVGVSVLAICNAMRLL